MIILHTLEFDEDYSKLGENMAMESLKPIEEYGLPEFFYGGTVSHIGKLKDRDIYLLIDARTNGLQIVDIAVDNLDSYNTKVLKQYAESKGIKFKPVGESKDELIDKIKTVALTIEQRLSVA